MLGEFLRDTWHVLGGPCKDVLILTEEIDEPAFLFAIEVGSHDSVPLWVVRVQGYYHRVWRLQEVGGLCYSRLAKSLVIAAGRKLLDRVVAMACKQPDLSPEPKESETQGSFHLAKETKKIPLDLEHPERHAVIGANLDSK